MTKLKPQNSDRRSGRPLVRLNKAISPAVFLRWTLHARSMLAEYWRTGDQKHLRAFAVHLAAMRQRAMEAKK